jgi:enamine deaminase RidA (YjgF/YER057c/UK114 family)
LDFAGFVIVSGQGPFDAAGNVIPAGIEAETMRTLENVRPCRTTVQAGLDGIKVEIDALSYTGS